MYIKWLKFEIISLSSVM